ncbi:MAG: 4a-hydroxytetrahydrobiopterin dehydratase [Acidimicrobiia bacterium]|nr:4a-hydroxytetrahydrobiopterin dehydratase [Acidimicrobiia bacterium]
MATLTDDDVQKGLATLAGWERERDAIVKEYKFDGFGDAIAFVVRLAFKAEKADHHPDLDVRYNRVRVALSTHSEGGITAKDLALAAEAEGVAGR